MMTTWLGLFYLQLNFGLVFFCLRWKISLVFLTYKSYLRKILVSVKFLSAILGPEMAAPI